MNAHCAATRHAGSIRRLARFSCALAASFLAAPALAQVGQSEGINDSYKSRNVDVQEWVQRFEGEGREAFDLRREIVRAVGLEAGQSVADVGAGTGLFEPLLAHAVGSQGTVYAIDIAPAFIQHIEQRARTAGLTQVKTVLSNERSIELPASSVDVIFTCDAYHHFVHYGDMLASMRKALKPGGELIVVDFDVESKAIPRPMIEHVGRTKNEFRRQIEDAGFTLAEDLTLEDMKASFMYRFVKATEH
jgi:cyclopropane fatty-acyl-phospholipid synthase-like methyltransferase